MADLKILAVIPCYNEERFISDVVSRTLKHIQKVIVIDDGSRDRTVETAKAAGAAVIEHGTNRGPGEAIKTGFEAARQQNADILVTLDGDGQHNPDEISQLLAPLLKDEADLVIGSRFIKNLTNVPRYRKFGIDVITWLLNFGSKIRLTDAQSGYRAYSRKALQQLMISEPGFSFSVELLIAARNKGLRMKEVPVSCLYHDQGSTLNPIRHGLSVAFSVVRLRIKYAFAPAYRGKSAVARDREL